MRTRKADLRTPGIRQIADRLEPKMRRRFLDAIAALRGEITLDMLAQAVQQGIITTEIEAIFIRDWPRMLGPASTIPVASYAAVGALTGEAVATALRVGFAFDLKNPRAATWAGSYRYGLVKDLTDTTRGALQNVLGRAHLEGIPAASAARMIRPTIGLTDRGIQAVVNYRDKLINAGRTEAAIERLVTRYEAKLIRARALLISRTEIHRAAREGQQEGWRQAVEQGVFTRAQASRIWHTALDERQCDSCDSLNDAEAGLETQFVDYSGESFFGPEDQHPACRCRLSLRIAPAGAGLRP